MSIRLKELLDGIRALIEGKRILAVECEEFVTSEKLLVHLDDDNSIEIEAGYVYDARALRFSESNFLALWNASITRSYAFAFLPTISPTEIYCVIGRQ